jgi:response regulator RpfG family c-di-GMP phosphodiesterase
MRAQSGVAFDPALLSRFLELVPEIEHIGQLCRDQPEELIVDRC